MRRHAGVTGWTFVSSHNSVFQIRTIPTGDVWRTLPALLALCVGNRAITGGFPSKKASNAELSGFLYCCPERSAYNQSRWRWLDRLWCSCDGGTPQVLVTPRRKNIPRIVHNVRAYCVIPDIKVHGACMGPTWDRQDPGGTHADPSILAIWDVLLGFGRTIWSKSIRFVSQMWHL